MEVSHSEDVTTRTVPSQSKQIPHNGGGTGTGINEVGIVIPMRVQVAGSVRNSLCQGPELDQGMADGGTAVALLCQSSRGHVWAGGEGGGKRCKRTVVLGLFRKGPGALNSGG